MYHTGKLHIASLLISSIFVGVHNKLSASYFVIIPPKIGIHPCSPFLQASESEWLEISDDEDDDEDEDDENDSADDAMETDEEDEEVCTRTLGSYTYVLENTCKKKFWRTSC